MSARAGVSARPRPVPSLQARPRVRGTAASRAVKRGFDLALSGAGLIASAPLWLLVSLAVWLEDRGPVFYRQERSGLGGASFVAFKFRSMIPEAEAVVGAVQA